MRYLLLLTLAIALCGCASSSMTVYNVGQIQEIDEWSIAFMYQTGEVEKTIKGGGVDSVAIKQTGRNAKDLELRDEVYFRLKDKHSINVKKSSSDSSGKILLHPIYFTKWYAGHFQSCTVTLVDSEGTTLARIKVKNGDRNASFKEDDSFAKFLADAIAKALAQSP